MQWPVGRVGSNKEETEEKEQVHGAWRAPLISANAPCSSDIILVAPEACIAKRRLLHALPRKTLSWEQMERDH